jgi:SET domain-containing protein
MDITKEVINHLHNNIKTEIKISNVDGVGVFAIRDIKVGEEIFPVWKYETGIYLIPNDDLYKLPQNVQILLDKYFINDECGFKVIRLFKELNFLFHGFSYCNSAFPNQKNTNMDIYGIATRDIKEGEEILEWYTENIYLDDSK